MSRVFLCRRCQQRINRFAAAPPPTACLYCKSPDLVELHAEAPEVPPAKAEAFACERGEPCTRLGGGDCPGGKGC